MEDLTTYCVLGLFFAMPLVLLAAGSMDKVHWYPLRLARQFRTVLNLYYIHQKDEWRGTYGGRNTAIKYRPTTYRRNLRFATETIILIRLRYRVNERFQFTLLSDTAGSQSAPLVVSAKPTGEAVPLWLSNSEVLHTLTRYKVGEQARPVMVDFNGYFMYAKITVASVVTEVPVLEAIINELIVVAEQKEMAFKRTLAQGTGIPADGEVKASRQPERSLISDSLQALSNALAWDHSIHESVIYGRFAQYDVVLDIRETLKAAFLNEQVTHYTHIQIKVNPLPGTLGANVVMTYQPESGETIPVLTMIPNSDEFMMVSLRESKLIQAISVLIQHQPYPAVIRTPSPDLLLVSIPGIVSDPDNLKALLNVVTELVSRIESLYIDADVQYADI